MKPERTPYPGLRSFRRSEADRFFGRDNCIDAMVDRLAATHFLAVVGSSGCGKSSLVKTGLVRALEMGLIATAGSRWCVAEFTPGSAPLRRLAEGLLKAQTPGTTPSEIDIEFLRAELTHGPRSLIEWCKAGNLPEGMNLMLLVDQFEELFRYEGYDGQEEAEAFVELLIESAHNAEVQIYVTLTMRSEFLGACSLIEQLAEEINKGMFLTPRMTRTQCEEAIVGPSRKYKFKIEDSLVNRLLNDLARFAPWDAGDKDDQLDRIARRADQLPLLQYTLNRMWMLAKQKAKPGEEVVLRLTDYESTEIGELSGALNAHAEEILGRRETEEGAKLSEEDQPIVEALFRALTIGSTVSEAVRRQTRLRDLIQICGGNDAAVRKVVDVFRAPGCNFLAPESNPADPRPLAEDAYIDISHESLIRQWKDFSGWLASESTAARLWRRLLERSGEDELLHGKQLAELMSLREGAKINWAWAARYDDTLSGQQRRDPKGFESAARERFDKAMKFLNRSQAEEQQREKETLDGLIKTKAKEREIKVMRWGLAACLFLAAIIGAVAFVAYSQRQAALAYIHLIKLIPQLEQVAQGNGKLNFTSAQEKLKRFVGACMGDDKPADVDAAKVVYELRYKLCDELSRIYLTFNSQTERGALDRASLFATREREIAQRLVEMARRGDDAARDDAQQKLAKSYFRIGEARWANVDFTNTKDGAEPTGDAQRAYGEFLRLMIPVADEKNLATEQWQTIDQWRRDLSLAYERVGDVAQVLNQLDIALQNYNKKQAITVQMIAFHKEKKHPPEFTTYWLGDDALSLLNIGDIQMLKGDHEEAEKQFREMLGIVGKLLEQEPTNPTWQWRFALAYERIGDTWMKKSTAMKDASEEAITTKKNEALGKYKEFFKIVKELAANDESNSKWKRGLAIAYERLGDAYLSLGQFAEAAKAYGEDFKIAQALNDNEPGNADFRRDLSISVMKLGDTMMMQGKYQEALERYGEYKKLAVALVEEDRANADWQRDRAISYQKMGLVLQARGDVADAKREFAYCLASLDKFLEHTKLDVKSYDPRNDRPMGVRQQCKLELQKLSSAANPAAGGN